MEVKEEDNIDLSDSEGMNADQQALFLNVQRSKSASADSVFGKLLPAEGDAPPRSLVWDIAPQFGGVLLPQVRGAPRRQAREPRQLRQGRQVVPLRVFRKVHKQKVRSRCDYDKNICGYITKKVIREFVSKSYEEIVMELVRRFGSNYHDCRAYYLRKVELVTGPSHLPQLLVAGQGEGEGVAAVKRVFRSFYRWFLKERYLRYLLLEGKMTNKQAYIEYKNTQLFRLVKDQEELVPEVPGVTTRSKSKPDDNFPHD